MAVPGGLTPVRRAVRAALERLPAPVAAAPLVVGCSGGADSLALLLAAHDLRPGEVTAAIVDHGLQEGSAERSAALAAALEARGIPAAVHPVVVGGAGGLEAAARTARYAALAAARPHPCSPVLLGHTLDDQAETVLLGLGRGSGARSLAGMREWDEPWLRPLLQVRRAQTAAVFTADPDLGLTPWSDPHNTDPRFTRARLRHEVLPLLEEVLQGGVAEALARTAAQLHDDDTALTTWATHLLTTATTATPHPRVDLVGRPNVRSRSTEIAQSDDRQGRLAGLVVAPLVGVPVAVRRRVLRAWLDSHGVGYSAAQLGAVDALVGDWRGQGGPRLPGGLDVVRAHGRLELRRT